MSRKTARPQMSPITMAAGIGAPNQAAMKLPKPPGTPKVAVAATGLCRM